VTARERLPAVAAAFAGRGDLGFRSVAGLETAFVAEFGSLDVLDMPVPHAVGAIRAVAPESVYHVLASNLDVSAETSLVLGLMLGSRLHFKLPSAGLPGFEKTVAGLPPVFAERVVLHREHRPEVMKGCDAVVVFGNDETVAAFHAETGWRQRFLGYGHKMSAGLVDAKAAARPGTAAAAAREILAFEQKGCLSPQIYLLPSAAAASAFAGHLAAALEAGSARPGRGPVPQDAAVETAHARQAARLRGAKVAESKGAALWTVVMEEAGAFSPGPGHGFIVCGACADPKAWLAARKGTVSALSFSGGFAAEERFALAEAAGASRVCATGGLQNPPLAWRHDGRTRMADLVRWITADAVQ
jgi:hypothetical protein